MQEQPQLWSPWLLMSLVFGFIGLSMRFAGLLGRSVGGLLGLLLVVLTNAVAVDSLVSFQLSFYVSKYGWYYTPRFSPQHRHLCK